MAAAVSFSLAPSKRVKQSTLFAPDAELTDAERMRRSLELQQTGNSYAEQERWSAALSAFEAAIGFTPSRAELYELKAQVQMALGFDAKAVQSAERALEIEPQLLAGYLTLGRALVNTADLDRALDILQKARALIAEAVNAEVEAEIVEIRRLLDARDALKEEKENAPVTEDPMDLDDILNEVDNEFLDCGHGDVTMATEAAAIARKTRHEDKNALRRGFRDETPVQPTLSRDEGSAAEVSEEIGALEPMDVDDDDFQRNIASMDSHS